MLIKVNYEKKEKIINFQEYILLFRKWVGIVMDYILKEDKKLLILPALISFILTFLLLFKYSYPISWDVYYHIHMIDLYLNNGLVFWDYTTVAPKGRLIMYPPLFHLSFALLSKLFNTTPIELCRNAQPLFSFYLIGIITYVSYKLSNIKCAVLTGFLAMFCFITFNRTVICTPATIAIGLFMCSCLFIHMAVEENNMKYLVYSAICLALIWNLHMATALLTCGVVGIYGLIQLLRKKLPFKFVITYFLVVILLGMPWWIYISLNYSLVFNSIGTTNAPITNFFFKYYGIIPSLLLLIGYYVLLKEKNSRTIFLLVWTFSLIIVSQVYILGFNTVSIRILEVAAYSLIIVSGIGLYYIYEDLTKSIKVKNIIFILVIFFSITSSLLYVDSYTPDVLAQEDSNTTIIDEKIHIIINPVTTIFKPTVISSRFADSSLAHSRYEVMQYFIEKKSRNLVVSEDAIMDTIIVSTSNTPVVYGGFTESIPEYVTDPVHIIKGWSNKDELHKLNVGHILLKQNTTVPYYAEEILNNSHYKICKIKEEYR